MFFTNLFAELPKWAFFWLRVSTGIILALNLYIGLGAFAFVGLAGLLFCIYLCLQNGKHQTTSNLKNLIAHSCSIFTDTWCFDNQQQNNPSHNRISTHNSHRFPLLLPQHASPNQHCLHRSRQVHYPRIQWRGKFCRKRLLH